MPKVGTYLTAKQIDSRAKIHVIQALLVFIIILRIKVYREDIT